MGKNKLAKFKEMKGFKNVFEPPMDAIKKDHFALKGKWNEDFFENNNPITLELGCGKGEYSVNLARKYPNRNFIGIDIKGARMWRGAKTALEENLDNVAFLRTKVEFIDRFFAPGEVDEIWLTFSDPQPKKPNKRLSSRPFVLRYKEILKANGVVHVKTDSPLLYEFTCEQMEVYQYDIIHQTGDVYGNWFDQASKEMQEILSIQTHYEKLFSEKGHIITYCAFIP